MIQKRYNVTSYIQDIRLTICHSQISHIHKSGFADMLKVPMSENLECPLDVDNENRNLS